MPQTPTLEERLSHVENDLAQLKSQLAHLGAADHGAKQDWIDRIRGSFKDDPEFEEVLRLGREIRCADRPDVD